MALTKEEAQQFVDSRALACPHCGEPALLFVEEPQRIPSEVALTFHDALQELREDGRLRLASRDEAIADLTSGRGYA